MCLDRFDGRVYRRTPAWACGHVGDIVPPIAMYSDDNNSMSMPEAKICESICMYADSGQSYNNFNE
jgi:hypothetical protein